MNTYIYVFSFLQGEKFGMHHKLVQAKEAKVALGEGAFFAKAIKEHYDRESNPIKILAEHLIVVNAQLQMSTLAHIQEELPTVVQE